MKRTLLIINTLLFCIIINAQTPEKVYSIAKVSKPHEWYVEQAELWWKVLEKDKKNENAWFNYFKANRYASMTYNNINRFDGDKNKGWVNETSFLMEAEEIIKKTDEYIPGTYVNYRIKIMGYPGDDDRFGLLQKAYSMNPEDAEMYDSFVTYYEMKGDTAKRKEFNEKLYRKNEESAGFINYSYNVLVSLKPGAILFTFGDNDTYPCWILQDVFNFRKDVIVLNIPLLSDSGYRSLVFKKLGIPALNKEYKNGSTSESEKDLVEYIIQNKKASQPIYIGLPAWSKTKGFESKLYLVGLALEFSEENIDNIALLKNNFENKYLLDYAVNRFTYDISSEIVDRMNINYLPGIFKLYEHYTLSGDENKANKMKELGLTIAQRGGEEWLDKAESIFK